MGCLPDTARVTCALGQLELLVSSDIIAGDTTAMATHVLPTADQLERADLPAGTDLTMTGVFSQYTAPIVPLAAERRPMWWSLAQIGRRLGHDVLPGGADPDVATDDDVLAHMARKARSTFEELRANDGALMSEPAVYGWVSEVLLDGRFNVAPAALVERLSGLGSPSPLVLIPRRQVRHMNSVHYRDGDRFEVLMHPDDGLSAGATDGGHVVVTSATGNGHRLGSFRLRRSSRRGLGSPRVGRHERELPHQQPRSHRTAHRDAAFVGHCSNDFTSAVPDGRIVLLTMPEGDCRCTDSTTWQ